MQEKQRFKPFGEVQFPYLNAVKGREERVKDHYRRMGRPSVLGGFRVLIGNVNHLLRKRVLLLVPGRRGNLALSSGNQLTVFTTCGGSATFTIASLTGSTLQFSVPLDPKDTNTVQDSSTDHEKFTYYDADRTTLTR